MTTKNQDPTVLGGPDAGERAARVEAALHAKLDAIAQRHEDKVLEGIAGLIAKYEAPDRRLVPDAPKAYGEGARLSRPWDSSPERMRLPDQERRLRCADGDFWMVQWLRSVKDKDFAGRVQADARLTQVFPDLYRADTLEGTADGAGGYASGTGGVLLPRPLENLITINLAKIAKMAKLARPYTMTAQEHGVPTAAAATAYMQGEATSPLTGGEPTLAQAPLVANEAIGRLILGKTFLEDQAANVVPVFVELMADALAELEDAEILRLGTGTAPHLTRFAATAFTETTSGSYGVGDAMRQYRLLPQRYRTNAIWLVGGTLLGLLSNVRDGMGRPFYTSLLDPPQVLDDTAEGARLAGAVGFLFGKPVHEVDMTAGEIYFGDFYRNYAFGRRRGITVEASGDFLFDTRRMIWLISQRIAGNNVDTAAGQLCAGITACTSV